MKKFFLFFSNLLFIAANLHAQSALPDTEKIKAMTTQLNAAMQAQDYKTSASIGKQLIGIGMNGNDIYFAEAAALGLSGDKTGAVLYFDTAASKGFNNANNWQMFTAMLGISNDPVITKDGEIVKKNSEKNSSVEAKDVNPELHKLYLADQSERTGIFSSKGLDTVKVIQLVHNDSLRNKQTYALLKNNSLKTARDFEEAGLILQHGHDTSDYWTGHQLALASIKLGNNGAKWLAAATLDRYFVAQHKPQKYGTQSFFNEKTDKLELYAVDPAVTDAERAEWNCPPLAHALDAASAVYDKK